MTAHELANDFLKRLHDRLVSTRWPDQSLQREVDAVLLAWPAEDDEGEPVEPKTLPATRYIEEALDFGDHGTEASIVKIVRALAPHLRWTFDYKPHPLYPDLGSRIAFADIAGPTNLKRSDDLLVGLTLIAPDSLYPAHAHPAIELYLPIGGTAIWTAGAQPAARRGPGSLILHPSNIAHTTRTETEPLVAVYIWRGDLSSPSVFLD